MNNILTVASFDIGKKNFSFCVEEFDRSSLNEIKTTFPRKRFNLDGSPTVIFDEMIKACFNNGKIILLENVDLTKDCEQIDKKFNNEWLYNMNNLLDKYSEIFTKCSVILIETQMAFGSRINFTALKLAQHCCSYFTLKFPKGTIEIVDFPAYNKTRALGAVKSLVKTKPQRKKWCITKAKQILESRNLDHDFLLKINESKKKDDLCDVICQLQAWKIIVTI